MSTDTFAGLESPDLSIVVAAWRDPLGLTACLEALAVQTDSRCEVIVVAGFEKTDAIPEGSCLTWIADDGGLLVPQLWARGITAARGNVVALTTSHFLPHPEWVSNIRSTHGRVDSFGVGGPIDPPRGRSAVDWATYFLRYSNYFHLKREQTVHEIAGDNAAYRRAELRAHRAVIADGFWEPDFHRAVLRAGGTLTFNPDIRVTQQASYPVHVFMGQRLRHGRQFGFSRVHGRGPAARLFRVATGVLVPAVLYAKIATRVARSGRDVGAFLRAMPVLIMFILAWSVGEVWGYLSRTGVEQGSSAPSEIA